MIRFNSLLKQTVSAFTSLYESKFTSRGPFTTLQSFLGRDPIYKVFPKAISTVALNFLKSHSINGKFVDELVSAAVRVNYAQRLDGIDALGMMVSLATDGAISARGGNRKLFERFISEGKDLSEDVGARFRVELETKVRRLDKVSEGGRFLGWNLTYRREYGEEETEFFETVILACPPQLLEPKIEIDLKDGMGGRDILVLMPRIDYLKLWVNFALTNVSNFSWESFGVKEGKRKDELTSVYAVGQESEWNS
jgi:prenylcysteine oxidase / farnesylcysteine lyase